MRAGDARGGRGIIARKRVLDEAEVTVEDGIPVTTVVRTLLDLATILPTLELERAITRADANDQIDPEALRAHLERYRGRRGVAPLRALLDRDTFVLSDSELEQRFVPIARRAGLPKPRTRQRVNGFRVDFWWPELGLIVETDGLRYHRSPSTQARDRERDQIHAAAGLTPLRFTHAQVRFKPGYVERILRRVGTMLEAEAGSGSRGAITHQAPERARATRRSSRANQ